MYRESERGVYEHRVNIRVYRNKKIRMLKDEFCLKLTEMEINHFHTLTTHVEIDQYAHYLLASKL